MVPLGGRAARAPPGSTQQLPVAGHKEGARDTRDAPGESPVAPKAQGSAAGAAGRRGGATARDAVKGERLGGGSNECLCGHRGLRVVPLGHPSHLCLQPPGVPARVSGRAGGGVWR